ncbi:MAG: hypothetical protein SFV54_19825 [Bryobacteraceae bacterium]|nr:hypothetical protein [Bryobacteraceae bacterium]
MSFEVRLPSETVILVGVQEDYVELAPVLGQLGYRLWQVETETEAISLMRLHEIAVVVATSRVRCGDWRTLLASVGHCADPPLVVVATHQADGFLLAEVLLAGGYDTLPLPFVPHSAAQVVRRGCQRWRREREKRQAREVAEASLATETAA